jgi:hypothetical protein
MNDFLGQVNGVDMVLALTLLLLYIRPQPSDDRSEMVDTETAD